MLFFISLTANACITNLLQEVIPFADGYSFSQEILIIISAMTDKLMNSDKNCVITVEVIFVKEDDYIVAYCPSLQLTGYGHTEGEARESFEIELNIFLEETSKKGTLEKYLLGNGWILQKVPEFNYQPPKIKAPVTGVTLKQEQLAIPVYC